MKKVLNILLGLLLLSCSKTAIVDEIETEEHFLSGTEWASDSSAISFFKDNEGIMRYDFHDVGCDTIKLRYHTNIYNGIALNCAEKRWGNRLGINFEDGIFLAPDTFAITLMFIRAEQNDTIVRREIFAQNK